MKNNLSAKQREILLGRQANQTRLARVPPAPANRVMRIIGEVLAGLFFGGPLGFILYYMVLYAYYPFFLVLGLTAASTLGSLGQTIAHGLNFGPVVTVVLAALSVVCCWYFTRVAIRQGYRVFAWVQLPLMLSAVLAMFYLTIVYQKPLLPFYGQ